MKAILKLADYRWYDSVVDPPIARDKEERRMKHGRTYIGGAIGAGLGVAAGTLAGLKVPSDNPIAAIVGLGAMGALTGLTAGSAAGEALGNRAILKRRLAMQLPLESKSESSRKNEAQSLSYPLDRFKRFAIEPDTGQIKKNLKPDTLNTINVKV